MPHKADETFFDTKREWSKKKDQILTYYLKPYLAKVVRLGRPVVLLDGFAGRGEYRDNEPGSPLYLCAEARASRDVGRDVSVLCIEEDESNYKHLRQLLSKFSFADTRFGRFDQYVDEIVALASTNTLFLYLDPYTVEGLDWASLDRIFAEIGASGSSVEILLNFNAAIFVRSGRLALKFAVDAIDADDGDEDRPAQSTPIDKLDRIVGGDWWKKCIIENAEFDVQVHKVAETFKNRLGSRFNEACMFPVRERASHRCPKYYLVFGSRHPDALILMNEAMGNAVQQQLISMDLFAGVELPTLILECTSKPLRRMDIVANVVRLEFARFREKDIVKAINALIKEGSLVAENGVTRTNRDTMIQRAPNLLM